MSKRYFPGAERVADGFFGAGIHAVAAQNAFAVFHLLLHYHRVDIQPHRAVANAQFAVGAG
jgi:hypothetical protein